MKVSAESPQSLPYRRNTSQQSGGSIWLELRHGSMRKTFGFRGALSDREKLSDRVQFLQQVVQVGGAARRVPGGAAGETVCQCYHGSLCCRECRGGRSSPKPPRTTKPTQPAHFAALPGMGGRYVRRSRRDRLAPRQDVPMRHPTSGPRVRPFCCFAAVGVAAVAFAALALADDSEVVRVLPPPPRSDAKPPATVLRAERAIASDSPLADRLDRYASELDPKARTTKPATDSATVSGKSPRASGAAPLAQVHSGPQLVAPMQVHSGTASDGPQPVISTPQAGDRIEPAWAVPRAASLMRPGPPRMPSLASPSTSTPPRILAESRSDLAAPPALSEVQLNAGLEHPIVDPGSGSGFRSSFAPETAGFASPQNAPLRTTNPHVVSDTHAVESAANDPSLEAPHEVVVSESAIVEHPFRPLPRGSVQPENLDTLRRPAALLTPWAGDGKASDWTASIDQVREEPMANDAAGNGPVLPMPRATVPESHLWLGRAAAKGADPEPVPGAIASEAQTEPVAENLDAPRFSVQQPPVHSGSVELGPSALGRRPGLLHPWTTVDSRPVSGSLQPDAPRSPGGFLDGPPSDRGISPEALVLSEPITAAAENPDETESTGLVNSPLKLEQPASLRVPSQPMEQWRALPSSDPEVASPMLEAPKPTRIHLERTTSLEPRMRLNITAQRMRQLETAAAFRLPLPSGEVAWASEDRPTRAGEDDGSLETASFLADGLDGGVQPAAYHVPVLQVPSASPLELRYLDGRQ